jgi:hypothetical protein
MSKLLIRPSLSLIVNAEDIKMELDALADERAAWAELKTLVLANYSEKL